MHNHLISTDHRETPAQLSPWGTLEAAGLCLVRVPLVLLFQLLLATVAAPAPSQRALPANKLLLISKEGPLCSLLSTGPVPLL